MRNEEEKQNEKIEEIEKELIEALNKRFALYALPKKTRACVKYAIVDIASDMTVAEFTDFKEYERYIEKGQNYWELWKRNNCMILK